MFCKWQNLADTFPVSLAGYLAGYRLGQKRKCPLQAPERRVFSRSIVNVQRSFLAWVLACSLSLKETDFRTTAPEYGYYLHYLIMLPRETSSINFVDKLRRRASSTNFQNNGAPMPRNIPVRVVLPCSSKSSFAALAQRLTQSDPFREAAGIPRSLFKFCLETTEQVKERITISFIHMI